MDFKVVVILLAFVIMAVSSAAVEKNENNKKEVEPVKTDATTVKSPDTNKESESMQKPATGKARRVCRRGQKDCKKRKSRKSAKPKA